MGLKDLLKSTVKRALGRGAPPAPEPPPRPTRSGSHPAPPPWRAAAEPAAEPVVAPTPEDDSKGRAPPGNQPTPSAAPFEQALDPALNEGAPPQGELPSGALPPGDEPNVAAPTLDVLLDPDPAAGDEAWAPTAEERARWEELPETTPPPPAITPSASHDVVVELQATPLPGAPATGMPTVNPDAEFKVHLINEQEGIDLVITTFVGEPVLDAADRQGLALPYSCRNGGCTICAGKLVSGEADMGDQYVLEPEQIAAGFRLLCCAWVTSDATIITHQNDAVS